MLLNPSCFLLTLLPTLHPIIVRRAATGDLLIKIHVAGQPVKTLQRPAADTLARSLKRVSRSFAARRKKGTHGNPEPCFLFDARGVELDPSMSALQAWSCAARLRFGVGSGRLAALNKAALNKVARASFLTGQRPAGRLE